MENPYEVLGVAPDANFSQVAQAYKRLVKELHPDKQTGSPFRSQNEERLKKVNAAYEQLKKELVSASRPDSDKTSHDMRAESRRNAREAWSKADSSASGEDAEAASANFWEAVRRAEEEGKRRRN